MTFSQMDALARAYTVELGPTELPEHELGPLIRPRPSSAELFLPETLVAGGLLDDPETKDKLERGIWNRLDRFEREVWNEIEDLKKEALEWSKKWGTYALEGLGVVQGWDPCGHEVRLPGLDYYDCYDVKPPRPPRPRFRGPGY